MNKNVNRKIIKKYAIRWLIMAISIVLILLFSGQFFIKRQIMDKLNYDIILNEDGSADITETWDIYIDHTNTIFRTFKKTNKYGNISNVKVKDLKTERNLNKIDYEMYHVTTDSYYALTTKPNIFEIAWGTGMENKIGKKQYQVTYTITNVVNSYKDCQEFYWKLLDTDNGIPVKKVTGTITMPESVRNKENLKAWGHGPLNGKIDIESNDKIKFSVNNLDTGKMLEIRVVTLENMFNVNNSKINNYRFLNQIINEESKSANETNNFSKYFYSIIIAIYSIAIIINILQSIKFYKISKRKNDGIIHTDLQYYRDIPRSETSTPPEAAYLYFFNKDKDNIIFYQSNMVSATILDLTLKGYINLRVNGKNVYVKIMKDIDGLNEDEKAVYKILKGTSKKEKGEFEISKINAFAKKHYNKYSELINKMINESRESIYNQKLIDKANKKAYKQATSAKSKYSIILGIIQFILVGYIIGLLPFFNRIYTGIFRVGFETNFIILSLILLPFILSILIELKMKSKSQNKIAVLTQKGTEEQEQWKALARYIKDFSMLDEKELPSLVIWEKYLIYATAFGIADKAIKQMKAKYPEVFVEEYWKNENMQEYKILNIATTNISYSSRTSSPIEKINTSMSRAYTTSLSEIAAHSSSSGSGGGGGFSGGGRWSAEAEAGMGGR